ncbi:MAG: 50S ribosomal protein L30 [Hadesarchaea archaeon]|nr:50S ribosomal protein L30 [Hadesarchaea archaeon]
MSKLAVIRVRGTVDVRGEVTDTLKSLRLTRPNHCVILEENSNTKGMLQKVKDYITWGSINEENLEKLLRKRGRLKGDKSLTNEIVSNNTQYDTISEFAKAVLDEEAELSDIEELKEVFRLRPPKKGYKSTQRSFQDRGALGYRGEKINDLIGRMI